VNKRLGESGIKLDEGTMVCCFDLKKSRNDWRISELVIINAPARAVAKPETIRDNSFAGKPEKREVACPATADSSAFGEEMRQPLEVAEDLTFKETGVPE
jgi:hypothetical protein